MSEILHRCMTKATTAEGDDIRRGFNWMLSRRGMLKVTTASLVCGDWTIPYDDISQAVLFSIRGAIFPCYVLRVKSGNRIYQFGLNGGKWGKFWKGELPFECERDSARIGYSWFSATVRILLVGYAAYLLWQWLT
jgi:hypothetical protein